MIEWPLILLGGLLGSSHCVGMCGALAISVGMGAPTWRANAARQLLYTVGRIFTYSVAGAAAGFAGWRLARIPAVAMTAQIGLAIVAGGLLIFQGLHAAGIVRIRRTRPAAASFCPARSLFATFLTAPGWHNALVAGVLTGFLPCGLVYAYLALAASSGGMLAGAATMCLFGTGTAPLMFVTGAGAGLLTLATRRRLLHAAAWCVVITGLLTVQRGLSWARAASAGDAPACPACSEKPLELQIGAGFRQSS